jgi:small subunit ribosomal protein S16
MVRIRLRRVGSKHRPIYRVVVADSRSPRDGAFIETIGHYNPLTEPATVVVNEERALKWLRDGAQPTDTVSSLLRRLGILDRFKQGSQSKSDS